MSERSSEARTVFDNGFNCAQSVLAVFAPELGLSGEDALRVAGAFGAGMGRMGKVCGAVTGAFMAIGLTSSKTTEAEDNRKVEGYRLVREFSKRFTDINGSIDCRELLGVDLSTDEGLAAASASGVFKTHCAEYVEDAVRILEEILEKPV